MIGWRKKAISTPLVDIHSHLIPAIDDGVETLDDSIELLRRLAEMGYKKIVTTPHIHPNYPNTNNDILSGLKLVKEQLVIANIDIEIEAAAEYFVDDVFMKQIKDGNEILSFGPNYVLVESSFLNKPLYFESCLFELQSKGYQPVLAHPERYRFLEGELDWLFQLKEMEILFQVTIGSFVGYYGQMPQKISKALSDKNMVDFLGSDIHGLRNLEFLEKGLRQKQVEKLCKSSQLRNKTLI